MDQFDGILHIVDQIVLERPHDAAAYSGLLDGTFSAQDGSNPHYDMFTGVMAEQSPFSYCELRLPRSDSATSIFVQCDFKNRIEIKAKPLIEHKELNFTLVFPLPENTDGLPYLQLQDYRDVATVSFSYNQQDDLVKSLIVDMKR